MEIAPADPTGAAGQDRPYPTMPRPPDHTQPDHTRPDHTQPEHAQPDQGLYPLHPSPRRRAENIAGLVGTRVRDPEEEDPFGRPGRGKRAKVSEGPFRRAEIF